MDGTYPGTVGVGDGARSLSGSGSSDSRSRWGGEEGVDCFLFTREPVSAYICESDGKL